MENHSTTMLVSLWTLLMTGITAHAGTPDATELQLLANFDDKTPGQPIGIGGALVGEPITLSSLDTEIIEITPGQNVLMVDNDLSSTNARRLRWEFLNNAEITEGIVTLSVEFTPSALDRYSLTFREATGSSQSFLTLSLSSTGSITASDAAGPITVTPTSYSANTPINVVATFDMEQRTSSVMLNDTVLFSDRRHGITDRGIGRFNMGYSSGSNGNPFTIDDLQVTNTARFPVILKANHNDMLAGQPLGTGGAAVGEPISIHVGLMTEIETLTADDRVLTIEAIDGTTASHVRWEFLEDMEILSGLVTIDFDVALEAINAYGFLIREQGSSGTSYPYLIFADTGIVSISDGSGSTGALRTYDAGTLYHIRMVFDMDAGTYSLLMDGEFLFEARPHGVSNGRGIGSFLAEISQSATIGDKMAIDNLIVRASEPMFMPIFVDGFED